MFVRSRKSVHEFALNVFAQCCSGVSISSMAKTNSCTAARLLRCTLVIFIVYIHHRGIHRLTCDIENMQYELCEPGMYKAIRQNNLVNE